MVLSEVHTGQEEEVDLLGIGYKCFIIKICCRGSFQIPVYLLHFEVQIFVLHVDSFEDL